MHEQFIAAFNPERLAYYARCLEVVRFLSHVDQTASCWDWMGATMVNGYGYLSWREDGRRKTAVAHRRSYELFIGCIPAGLVLDHLCRNRRCVNPNHLEAVTSRENILRGVGASAQNARRLACKRGHVFNAANTVISPRGRDCRVCHREDELARRRRAGAKELSPPVCPHGHEFTEKNTYRSKRGDRACRTCHRERVAYRRSAAL